MGDVEIRTDGGSDGVLIEAPTDFQSDLSVYLGGGKDGLAIRPGVHIGGDAVLHGGGGSDIMASDYVFAIWDQGPPDLISIEDIVDL